MSEVALAYVGDLELGAFWVLVSPLLPFDAHTQLYTLLYWYIISNRPRQRSDFLLSSA